ncbi:MFS transporter [Kutzneria sp. CA-103260]|uniref:MFS transporter n=1 Tax=Kutzneria sp. CA-103260 TaxID=2802641 RepID=UPI001BA69614|nr:MFS transporter [Kutzneria sp. CA-103260]QUQ68152.1 major facilitator superfamily transporter [Kutzneria sp. CA-103260]
MLAKSTAVFIVFVLNGVVFGSWAARVPALAAQVGATPAGLGLSLFGVSVGLFLAAPVAGRLCAAFGSRAVMVLAAAGGFVVLPLLGLTTSPLQLGLVLFVLGLTIGSLDVSMNIAAVTVIRLLDRPLMPVFHAGFSFGGLVGSVGAAFAAGLQWSPLRQFLILAVIGVVAVALIVTSLPAEAGERSRARSGDVVVAGPSPVRRPLLWLLALIALFSAVAEGASADWTALFLAQDRGVSDSLAAAGYSVYSVAMALTRLSGERVERRWGPYRMLVFGASLAAVGLLAAVTIHVPAVAYVGFAFAGVGLAYSFPVTMSLAGAAGRRADGTGGEREIGFVSTIAYTGFLGGPPLLGQLAQWGGLGFTLGTAAVVAALIVPAVVLVIRARRRECAPAAVGAPTV